ncbi:thymidine phosphorylase family protein [Pseudoduganella ginsengisoli]|uniref:Putative thymidine phosphorylase n=1 Tax=Pseudoduganella ginsengisoli TaxID=1462440 RepID=A0A6L6PWY0_9BURK|nr:thymidine phosphorylase family protein [Pseudoduganella ginsengisoli]MTW01729.1 thymidine phosphorylase [Pseudoduganella ginsengisoli]
MNVSHTSAGATGLRLRRLGIDTYQQSVVYLRADAPLVRSEGFEAQSRLEVRHLLQPQRRVTATLNVVHTALLAPDEIGVSEAAWRALGGAEGDAMVAEHAPPLVSFGAIQSKIFGRPLGRDAAGAVVADIAAGRYSDIELAAMISACSGNRLDEAETHALTVAMIAAGQRLHWEGPVVADKHCVGGLPGNRTTLLVVPMVAACGLTIPKTSSRAITSPAGTADAMETLAPVALDLPALRRVVDRTGGCIAWGGAMQLSPVDDMLIRVERPLGLDSDGLLVASILSKKAAAGSTHVLIDIPVGRTAKVRSMEAAGRLAQRLVNVGRQLGMTVSVEMTDGEQPVGRGVGPALEAADALAVLQSQPDAPGDLRRRALLLAGYLLELCGKAAPGSGLVMASNALSSGAAWRKFQEICEAQGGMRTPPRAPYTRALCAAHAGRVAAVDNHALACAAKLAGAPKAPAAGLVFHAPLGTVVAVGQPLLTLHAESPGELAYAMAYAEHQEHLVTIVEAP